MTLVFELFTLSRRNADIAVEYAGLMRRTREQVAGMLAVAQREGVLQPARRARGGRRDPVLARRRLRAADAHRARPRLHARTVAARASPVRGAADRLTLTGDGTLIIECRCRSTSTDAPTARLRDPAVLQRRCADGRPRHGRAGRARAARRRRCTSRAKASTTPTTARATASARPRPPRRSRPRASPPREPPRSRLGKSARLLLGLRAASSEAGSARTAQAKPREGHRETPAKPRKTQSPVAGQELTLGAQPLMNRATAARRCCFGDRAGPASPSGRVIGPGRLEHARGRRAGDGQRAEQPEQRRRRSCRR